MTTASISAAIRDGDLLQLARLLDTHDASLEDLEALIRRGPATRHLALLHVERRLAAPAGRDTLAGFARVLPATLDDGPEVAALLARLTRRLLRWGAAPVTAWRAAGLPSAVEVEWLRTEVAASAEALAREPFGERLLQALEPGLAEAMDPVAWIRALAGRDEEPLQRVAVDQLRQGLWRCRLMPGEARELLIALVRSRHDAVACEVLGELAEPWSLRLPAPEVALGDLLARPGVIAAVLEYAAGWRLEGPIRGAIEDPELAPALRQRAMVLAGALGSRRDIGAMIAIAASDPLLFGPPLLQFLRAQHRLGHFVADEDAPPLARVCLASGELDAGEVARLVFTVRHAFVAALAAAEADDPGWWRRAELLVALGRGPQGATPLAVGPILEAALEAATEPGVRRALIQAIGALGHVEGEAAVLAHLEREPRSVLGALRSIGGPAAVAALIAGVDRVRLRPLRDAALVLAWQLSEREPEARAAVRDALSAGEVPRELEASLGARASSDELVLLHGALHDARASDYLRRIAAVAGGTEWELLCDLLLRVVSDLATGREASRPGWGTEAPASALRSEAARSLPAETRGALEALGQRWVRAGILRPRAVLDAPGERAAGRLVISAMARALLERPDVTLDETAVLLRMLDPEVDRRVFPAIHRLLRRPEPAIRKVVIELLARDGADELLANLATLTGEDDIETVRQAIRAIGSLGARAARCAATLAGCLEHPSMNIKKAAAEALATAGGPEAVAGLMFWLGHHDNPGFRTALVAALRAILGPAYAATIVAAIVATGTEGADAARRTDLLIDALDGALASDDAVALCRRDEPVAARLQGAIASARIALGTGDRAGFAIAMAAEPSPRGRSVPGEPSELARQVGALVAGGFEDAAAQRVLAASRAPGAAWAPAELGAVRRFWFEWCARLDGAGADERGAAVVLLERLAALTAPTGDELAALARRHPAILAVLRGEPLDDDLHVAAVQLLTRAVAGLPPPTRLAIARELRALPERPNRAGLDPFELLRACGALLVRGDLDRALRCARHTADPAALERRILRQSFPCEAAAVPEAVRDDLARAARQADGAELAELRARLREPTAVLIAALIDAHAVAHDTHRRALVDWMEARQPLGAPPWTLTDRATARLAQLRDASARRPRPTDLDQPRSQPLRERLEAMLDAPAPEPRSQAAVALLGWPEPGPQARAAEAYLRGAAEVAASPALAAAVLGLGRERVLEGLRDPATRRRLIPLLESDPDQLEELVPVLLDVHDEAFDAGDSDTCTLVLHTLAAASPDVLLAALAGRFAGDDFRLADAVTGERGSGATLLPTRRLRSSSELEAAIELARRSGRDGLVERWRTLEIRPATLRASRGAFAEAVADLRGRSPAAASPAPDRAALLREATTGTPEVARRALTALARHPDPGVVALLHDRLGHADPRVRLHAHRLLRSCETREAYLEATLRLLGDPIDDVRRAAIRTVGHARFAPAVPALIALLTDRIPQVRRAAAEALVHVGEPSRGALRHALAGARPDRRGVYAEVLERLGTDDA